MTYIDPNTVLSPKAIWKLEAVIHNTGQGGWSAAEGSWDNEPCLAIRWNGSDSEDGVGSPQSRGYPTWFIIPNELQPTVRHQIHQLSQTPMVSCDIERPENYDYGAWRIEITLSSPLLKMLGTNDLIFVMPTLQKRMCHPEKEYVRAVNGELRGRVVEGKWQGDLYSNGIHEDDNPTKIDAVRDAFIQSIMRAIQQAGLIG